MNELAGGLRPSSENAALHSSLTMPSHPGHWQKPLAAISAHESFEQPSATAKQGDTKTGGGLRPSSEHAALHSSLTMPSHPGHSQKPLAAISAHESFEQPSATARQGDTKTGGGLRPSSEHASLHSSATMPSHPGHWQRPSAAISSHESVEQTSASGQMNELAGGLRPSSEHAALHSSATMPSHPGHWQKPLAAIS